MGFVRSKRKYYKYEYGDWTQPKLTANGTVGGDSYACRVNSTHTGYDGYKAFDNSSTTSWAENTVTDSGYIEFYSPVKLKVSKITIQNRNEYVNIWASGVVYGSLDGTNYFEMGTFTNTNITASSTWDINVTNQQVAKYIKISTTSLLNSEHTLAVAQMTLTAQEAIPVESTINDYDYYEYESLKHYILTRKKRNYYKYGTEPNATIVGSPTISNGVVSGFSSANYVTTPQAFNPSAGYNWEMVVKFTTGSSVSTSQNIFDNTATEYNGIGLFMHNSKIFISAGGGGSWTIDQAGVTTLLPNTTYWFKGIYDGSSYIFYLSTNKSDWNEEIKINSTKPLSSSAAITFGYSSRVKHTFNGSVDLTECNIIWNNKLWWYGTKAYEINLGDDVWKDWKQPTLTANGTMGGDSFAVACSSKIADNKDAYAAFDGDISTQWQSKTSDTSQQWLTFYNPKPLKLEKLKIYNLTSEEIYYPKVLYIQGSNDNSTWKTLYTYTGSSYTTEITCEVSSDTAYKYHRIYFYDRAYYNSDNCFAIIKQVEITAQELIKVGGSIEDVDFYEDRNVAYHPIVRGTRTYYKQTLNKRDTGTYTFTLDKEYNAKLLFVGNGCGGGSSQRDSKWFQSSGGSGACFEGYVKLPAGTYTVTLGTLGYGYNINNQLNCGGGVNSTDSYLTDENGNELIRVGCGARGTSHTAGGVGGTLTLGTIEVLETIKAVNGNQGNNINNGSPSSTSGYALSAYDNTKTGYGAGKGSWRDGGNVYGIAGIFDLVLETDINNYDYYKDIGTKIY